MAIVQISKIQQRSGNLVDLPQLDEAEFGFASDEKRLFIGKTEQGLENIEVLTSYSEVDFNQINGSYGNLDISITSNTAAGSNGQVLAFDGNNWVNRGGNAGGLLTFGDVSNVKITGGAIGYVLETDGTGNLSWTPKSTIIAFIENAESVLLAANQTYATDTYNANSVITVGNTSGYTSGLAIQFTGTAFGNLSVGNTFYVRNVISNTAFTISDTSNLAANFTLTDASGNLTVNLLGTVVTTTEDNFLIEGAEITITDAVGMTQLNGNSYYIDILTSNTFSLYSDSGLSTPIDSSGYNAYAYTSVTDTTASTNYVTVGDTTSFTINDPIKFIGTTFGGIFANQTYYVANITTAGAPGNITISETIGGPELTLTTASGTCNVYATGGRAICAVGGSGVANAAGANSTVQFNNSNLLDADADFTWNNNTGGNPKILTVNGNANVGNLNATGVVTSTRLFSNIGSGSGSPLVVTSTDRVANLNVSYSNVSDFEVVTTQTTGTFYPVFVSSSSTSNQALGVNSALSFNVLSSNLSLTGNLSISANANVGNIGASQGIFTSNITALNANLGNLATANFVTGTLTTASNAQPNLTSFGNGTQVTVAGNLNPNANVTYNLGNTTNRWNALYLSGSTIYLGNATITSNASGVVITNASGGSFTVGGTSAANGAAIVNGNSSVVVTANSNVNISSNGVANVLVVTNTGANITGTANVTGNANVGNIGATSGVFTGTISVTGNANVGNIGATSGVLTGTLSVTGNANVGNLGTAGLIIATGNVTGGNLVTSNAVSAATVTATGTITGGNLITTGNSNIGTLRVSGTSNLGPISNVTITGGSANQILKTNGSGTLSWTDATGGYYLHTQSSASTTWTVVHNLNNQYVTVEPIDNTGNSFVGRYDYPVINYTNANALTLTFSSAVTGWAAVVGGGFTYANVAGNITPGGFNTYVQFNDAGSIAGNGAFTFDKTTGTLNSTLFAGSGANLTNLNASNLSTGTVPSARLSGTYTITVSGSATTAGTVTTAAQPNITSVGTLSSLSVTGNISGANITGTHYGAATGLTSIPGANVSGTVPTATTAGTVTTAAQPNITSVGTLTGLTVSSTITGSVSGSAGTAGTVTTAAQPNITSVGTLTGLTVNGTTSVTGNSAFTVTNITSGANTTLGYITGNWTLTSGSRMQATYADLAEYYSADEQYSPGTVLEFGGREEVTLATDATTRVAGVVSTDPAYAMNAKCPGQYPVAIALQGRVPCKVRGNIKKGDMLVSGGGGYARPTTTPKIGTIIGKALQDFNGIDGVIEVAVGRL
jgi:hypothetical protein